MIFQNYPLTYCLHPTKYFNKYLQRDIVTPCGHCEACRTNKSNKLHNLIDLHSSAYRNCLFVTLTYNQRNIPTAKLYDFDDKTYLINKDGVILSECPRLSDGQKQKLYNKIKSKKGRSLPFGVVPYLDAHDLRLFMVRLRQRVKTKRCRVVKKHDTKQYRLETNKYRTDETFTYFAIGEYGPDSFRPHFHILLFFNFPETLQALERHISASWQLGNCDIRIADNNVSNYVSTYVTGSTHLPKIYGSASVRPFARKSLHFAFDAQTPFNSQLLEFEFNPKPSINKVIGGKDRSFYFSPAYQNSLYPKITGFSELPFDVLFSRYQLFERLRDHYAKQANVDPLCISIPFLMTAVKQDFKQHINPKPMHDASLDLYNFDFSSIPQKDKFTYNTLHKILLCSKLFYKNHIYLQLNPFNYVRRIINFWSARELDRLNNSLSILEDVDIDTQNLYYQPLEELSILDKSPLYQQFSEFVQNEANQQIKHRSQNDLNQLLYNF